MIREELYEEYSNQYPLIMGFREVTYEDWLQKQVIDLRTNKPLPPAEAEYEGHKQRHVNLHGSLDELFADFIRHNPNMDSYLDITIDRLLKWSYEQTLNPTE